MARSTKSNGRIKPQSREAAHALLDKLPDELYLTVPAYMAFLSKQPDLIEDIEDGLPATSALREPGAKPFDQLLKEAGLA